MSNAQVRRSAVAAGSSPSEFFQLVGDVETGINVGDKNELGCPTSLVVEDHLWGVDYVYSTSDALVYTYCPCFFHLPCSTQASARGWRRFLTSISCFLFLTMSAFFAYERAHGDSIEQLIALGAKVPYLMARGQSWRLITAGVLSGTPAHYALSSFALLRYAANREMRTGKLHFIELFLLGMIYGGTVSAFAIPAYITVGPAPGMMSIFGAWVVDIGLNDATRPILKASLLFFALAIPALLPTVDTGGHLTGLFVGAVAFPLSETNWKSWTSKRVCLRIALWTVAVFGVAAISYFDPAGNIP